MNLDLCSQLSGNLDFFQHQMIYSACKVQTFLPNCLHCTRKKVISVKKYTDTEHTNIQHKNILQGHSVHNNTEHFLWSQVGKWAIMGQKLIYYHIGTPTYMLNDVSKHPRPLKIMLNHIFKNQCHKPRNKKNTFLVSKVG